MVGSTSWRPQGSGIVMDTLHHAAEIRGIESVEELSAVPSAVKPEEIRLARHVIETSRVGSIWPITKTNTEKAYSA